MADTKTITFPEKRPNGAVVATVYYRDGAGASVDESEATAAEIVEFDEAGERVASTYGEIRR
jgi:hypothetical protein